MSDDHHSHPGGQSQIGTNVINTGASFIKKETNKEAIGDRETNTVLSSHDRLKRQAVFDPDKVLCPLEIVATHKFHTLYSTAGSLQNSIVFLVGCDVMTCMTM